MILQFAPKIQIFLHNWYPCQNEQKLSFRTCYSFHFDAHDNFCVFFTLAILNVYRGWKVKQISLALWCFYFHTTAHESYKSH